MLRALFACLALCLTGSAATAQAPPAYPGTATTFPASYGHADTNSEAKGSWEVSGPGVSGAPSGWNVTCTGSNTSNHTLTITIPASLPASSFGAYSASYVTGYTGGTDNGYNVGYSCSFQVVASPPTLPPAGNPAFSWQGSVAGVNTGNGNKTTVVPITGWTQRGGMPVSCAFYHNSQSTLAWAAYGNKWLPSDFTYLSNISGNPTLHWDNGLSYTFTKNGAAYTPPYGILDKLTSSNGVFTLTTTANTVYNFAFVPASDQLGYGNAYLSSIADMDGNTLSIGHNTDTTLSAVTDSTNRTLTYAYSSGRLVSVTDPLSRVWYFTYGTAGGTSSNNLWAVTLPVLNGQSYAEWFGYDANSNIIAMQSPQGHTINAASTFGYDTGSPPRLIWAKDPLGSKTTFTYNAASTIITDPNGHTTTHNYTTSRLTSVTDALNYSSSTAYDFNNIPSSMTDKRGKGWSYTSHFSNKNSPVSTSTDPLSYSSSSTYDAKNKVIGTQDAMGNTTASTYTSDSKEDLLTSSVTGTGSYPFKATSTVGGYSYGLPTTFTDPLKFGSSVGYDANGYVNSATDANNHTSTAVFNLLGWKTSSTDANNHTTSFTYDNWGRVTAVTAPDNTKTTTAYDLDGDVLTVTDANNHTVTNVYDADDRLIQTTNGRGDVVKYIYDGTDTVTGAPQLGLLSSKTDGNGHTTYYSYTARNEPAATYYPDNTSESVTYDPNGNVLTRTKADGSVIHYAYDADNRLTDITYPHLGPVHFGYDADGRKTLMTDATGTTTWLYTYDGVHLSQQANPQGTNTYVYDGDGRLSYKYANVTGAGVASYWYNTYDNAGRLISLRSTLDGTTTFAYYPAGELMTKTKGSGDYETYAYDTCDEVTSIGYWWADGTGQNALTYTYDPAGNVQTCNQGYYNTTYGYDGADQLVSETSGGTYPPPALGFTYDHNGNRLTQTVNGQPFQSFTYDAHDKLTTGTAGNETDHYDANGNLSSFTYNGGAYQFTWDDEDRLIGYTAPPGVTESYAYNGLGLRVGKTDRTGSSSYLTDGTSPGSPVLSDGHATYTPGLSENRGGSSAYYANDQLGNLWTLDGTSKSQLTYEDNSGFGGLVAGGSGGTPFGFGGGNGCQTDVDLGLVLMGHRYYDPRTGRFLSQDPAGDGDNWYAYAGNSPTNAVDPTGLSDGAPGSVGAPDQHYGVFEGGGDDTGNGFASWDSFPLYLTTSQRTRTGTYVWDPDPTPDNPDRLKLDLIWGPWGPWNATDSQPLGGGFMTSTAYPPLLMTTPPKWKQILWGALAAGAGILHGQSPLAPLKVPKIIVQEAKPGKTVEEKDDEKPGGSKFSIKTFDHNMGRLGSVTRDFLDELTESIQQTQKSWLAPFGGSTTGALEW